ncbi:MAG: dephospho-CoA kinase [Deltaproteobacteria bacterium]|jgi:dephospho-CoA kinase|nr:dephospho-CoA kinase [Deltaproteobacteria bacterium]
MKRAASKIYRIGLTGGIASGKSRVAKMLAGLLGCVRIDADEICRQLLEPDKEGWLAFTRVFGSEFLAGDGSIDRPKLRNKLFADEQFRRSVNDIIHPLVKGKILKEMNEIIKAGPGSKVLVEVPLLFEVQ